MECAAEKPGFLMWCHLIRASCSKVRLAKQEWETNFSIDSYGNFREKHDAQPSEVGIDAYVYDCICVCIYKYINNYV